MVDKDTGRKKGFAFVEFATEAFARAAIRTLNHVQYRGRALTVEFSGRDKVRYGGGMVRAAPSCPRGGRVTSAVSSVDAAGPPPLAAAARRPAVPAATAAARALLGRPRSGLRSRPAWTVRCPAAAAASPGTACRCALRGGGDHGFAQPGAAVGHGEGRKGGSPGATGVLRGSRHCPRRPPLAHRHGFRPCAAQEQVESQPEHARDLLLRSPQITLSALHAMHRLGMLQERVPGMLGMPPPEAAPPVAAAPPGASAVPPMEPAYADSAAYDDREVRRVAWRGVAPHPLHTRTAR